MANFIIEEMAAELARVGGRVLATDNVTFDPVTNAPNSFEELVRRTGVSGARHIPVSNANSDRTIYRTEHENFIMRAWHDWAHIRARAEFTPLGEFEAYQLQCADMRRILGETTNAKALRLLLWTEIVAQGEFLAYTGDFVNDQREFTQRIISAFEIGL
jgi:hypothetical protein